MSRDPNEGPRVFLALGGNLGEREQFLARAIEAIAALPDTRVVRCSDVIETPPWGITEQPDFLNQVIEVRTALSPRELLTAVKRIEQELGRVESQRWGPRAIDIDVVAYGRRQVSEPDLTIPHRDCTTRAFVLEPLRQIAPEVASGLLDGTWIHAEPS